jgi:hypothetical protein
MNNTRRFSAVSALMAASLALPAAGWAQTPQAPATAPAPAAPAPAANPMVGAPHAKTTSGRGSQVSLEQGVEQHIKDLHKELKITAAEEPQWDQFTQVMRDNAQAMMKSLDERGQQIGSMNAPDSMSSYAQLATQRSQDLVKLATAFQTLYATFSDQQKKDADALFRRQATAHAEKHSS